MHVKLHFNQKRPLKMGKTWLEVCQNLEGISVASYFHVYENEDAVSHFLDFVFLEIGIS
jgi:hypothetical protein